MNKPRQAASITVERCPCCGGVSIELRDIDDAIFATATVPPAGIDDLCAHLIATRDAREGSALQ